MGWGSGRAAGRRLPAGSEDLPVLSREWVRMFNALVIFVCAQGSRQLKNSRDDVSVTPSCQERRLGRHAAARNALRTITDLHLQNG